MTTRRAGDQSATGAFSTRGSARHTVAFIDLETVDFDRSQRVLEQASQVRTGSVGVVLLAGPEQHEFWRHCVANSIDVAVTELSRLDDDALRVVFTEIDQPLAESARRQVLDVTGGWWSLLQIVLAELQNGHALGQSLDAVAGELRGPKAEEFVHTTGILADSATARAFGDLVALAPEDESAELLTELVATGDAGTDDAAECIELMRILGAARTHAVWWIDGRAGSCQCVAQRSGMSADEIWRLPGPETFVEHVTEAVKGGACCAVVLPSEDPPHCAAEELARAFERKSFATYSADVTGLWPSMSNSREIEATGPRVIAELLGLKFDPGARIDAPSVVLHEDRERELSFLMHADATPKNKVPSAPFSQPLLRPTTHVRSAIASVWSPSLMIQRRRAARPRSHHRHPMVVGGDWCSRCPRLGQPTWRRGRA